MEDAQPNEVRLARKGSTYIPRVRVTRQTHTPYRRPPSYPRPLHNAGPSRWQPPPAPSSSTRKSGAEENGLVVVEAHLPPECHKGVPRSHGAREAWIKDQKHRLETSRRLSVVSFNYLDGYRRVLFTCRARQDIQSTVDHAEGSLQHRISLPPTKFLPPPTRIPRGPHPVDVHTGTNCIRSTPQSGIAPSTMKTRDAHNDLAQATQTPWISKTPPQSSVAGPSSINLGPSSPIQLVNTSPPVYQVLTRATSPARNVTDRASHSFVEEVYHTRWSTFCSGRIDVYLPSLSSDSRISSSEIETDRPPHIDQPPAQDGVQLEGPPVDRYGDSNSDICASNSVPARTMMEISESSTDHVLNVIRSSSRGRSVSLEGEKIYNSRLPDHALACDIVTFSLGSFDRPRRLLNNNGFTYIITAHGVIDQLGPNNMLKLDRNVLSPSSPFEEFVDDACILSHQEEPVIVLGHAREQNQISLLNLGRGRVPRPIALGRDWNTSKRSGCGGIPMSPLKFASGGYDYRVHMWEIAQDLSGASAVELAIKHSSSIHSLLPIHDTSHKLVSASADRSVSIYDMSAERVVQTIKLSHSPYHAHKTDSAFCTLLEVSHLETQFEVRDYRTPPQAVARFGSITEERRGRYNKADTWSQFVACGDKNGAVRFWDLRHASKEVATQQCFNNPVTQVVHVGPRWLACSKKNELGYIDLQCG